jgi:hypothetical protein
MHLAVTIKRDEDIDRMRSLIEAVRRILTAENVTVLEAPKGLNYPYPFPVVTVSEGPRRGRHFGSQAVDILMSISQK